MKDYPNNKGKAGGTKMYGPLGTPMTGQVKSSPSVPKIGSAHGTAGSPKKR